MNSNWFHITKGRYFTDTKKVGIDHHGGLFDKDQSKSTFIHETTHAFLCNATEMGIFLHDVEVNVKNFKHLSEYDKKKMIEIIFKSQVSAQEGFATYFQYGILKKDLTKNELKDWHSRQKVEYLNWLKPFKFVFRLSAEERDLLSQKFIRIVMNTSIRKDAYELGLLEDIPTLKKYIKDPDNNPNNRLRVLLKETKKDHSILKLPEDEIPERCGIKRFEKVSNKEIVNFITHISKLAGNPVSLTEDQIEEGPTADQVFAHVRDNTIVANLNLNLTENAELIYKTSDVEHYGDIVETLVISERGTRSEEEIKFLEPKFDEDPEIVFIMQTKYGEKYLHITSKQKSTELINNVMKNATLTIKFGDYNFEEDQVSWLKDCRSPDLVIFNHYWQLRDFFQFIQKNNTYSIYYCNVGSREDHVFRSLFTQVKHKTPLLSVNTMFPKDVDEVLKEIRDLSIEQGEKFIRKNKDTINSFLILWSGWDVRVDWVETMLDGDNLYIK